jgi:hypothetical protein
MRTDEKAFGLTLAEWVVAWSQWLVSLPAGSSPMNDRTGIRAGTGQRMPVWFLAPEPPGALTVNRTVVVPSNCWILWPGPNVTVGMPAGEWPDDAISVELDLALQDTIDRTTVIEMMLNGAALPDIRQYRVRTPIFSVVVPPNNIADLTVTPGKDHRIAAMTDGFFYLLPPLPIGKHLLQGRVEAVEPETGKKTVSQSTIQLIVQNPNEPLP